MKKPILLIFLVLSLISNAVLLTIHIKDNERYPDYSPEQIQDWNTFITALAWVESRWNDNAESSKQAVGYLQLTPIIIKDANRIVVKTIEAAELIEKQYESDKAPADEEAIDLEIETQE